MYTYSILPVVSTEINEYTKTYYAFEHSIEMPRNTFSTSVVTLKKKKRSNHTGSKNI
jgi:hypothetical protein